MTTAEMYINQAASAVSMDEMPQPTKTTGASVYMDDEEAVDSLLWVEASLSSP